MRRTRALDESYVPEPNSGCWLWTDYVDPKNGYGAIRARGKVHKAHRVVYQAARGPIPPSLELDHKCRTRCCVNPDHLEAVTHRENVKRGVSIVAEQMAKTHCIHGHPLAGANLRTRATRYGTRRDCLVCTREQNARGTRKARA